MSLLNFRLIQNHHSQNYLLDIGSGKGEFIEYMSTKNWNVESYDPFYKNNDIINFNSKFDIVTMWHSLEHIHNLLDVFSIINKSLSVNGYLLVAVPNIDAYDRKFFKKNWVAYDPPRHLYHFSIDSMRKLLDVNNFEIISIKRMYQDTVFNVISSGKRSGFINFFISPFYIFYCFIKIVFNKKYSSSLLYICKKK